MARGDEEFAEFVRASYSGLIHAAYLLTGDRHIAEDAAQAALVRTYAAWSRVRRDAAFAYTRRVLVNYVTDRWRVIECPRPRFGISRRKASQLIAQASSPAAGAGAAA